MHASAEGTSSGTATATVALPERKIPRSIHDVDNGKILVSCSGRRTAPQLTWSARQRLTQPAVGAQAESVFST